MLRSILAVLHFLPFLAAAQRTDTKLQQQLQDMIQDFHGSIGIYVHDLKHNKIVAIQADTLFPTASIVKMPIMAGVMQKINSGQLSYHQRLVYTDSLYYSEGDDILASFKDSAEIELGKVMMLMLTTSDNCASLWLQGLAGGGQTINALLDSLGFTNTRVNSRTPGREQNRTTYGWGQTTPSEIARFMERIVQKQLLGGTADEKMLRLLGRQYWDDEALSQIPPGIFTADKNGAVDASRSEVVYVNSPHNPYIFSIFTKNNVDTGWEHDNEAWVLTRKISARLWEYYNPGKNRKAATDVQ